MEDRRTALAVLLCMFVLMFWMEMVMAPYNRRPLDTGQTGDTPQSQAGQVAQQQKQVSTQAQTQQPAVPQQTTILPPPTPAEYQAQGFLQISNPLFELKLAKLGARVSNFLLKEYKAHKDSDAQLDMVLINEGGSLPLGVHIGPLSDEHVIYTLERVEGGSFIGEDRYSIEAGKNATFYLTGQLNESTKISKTIGINGSSYLLKVSVNLSSTTPDGASVWLEWRRVDASQSVDSGLNIKSYSLLGIDNKVSIKEADSVKEPLLEVGQQQWVTFGDRYFMAALIAPQPGTLTRIGKDGQAFYSRVSAGQPSADFNVFIGPKNHVELKQAGFQLERTVDLGMFAFIAHPLLSCIRFFYSLIGNYGMAIILLTLLIKTLFLPLTKSSFKSMKAMQTLQPEMKALRERIQDPTKLNQEMMALYKKHGVNPMGGCLPMLIQLPVFLGLYNALNNSIELRHAPFALWIDDLSSVERLEFLGVGIPVMVLLMGASMFVQMWTTPSAADPQQKKIMMMMPVIFTISFIIFPFPSGLVLYWLVNNLISIIQQMYLAGQKEGSSFQGTVLASVIIFFFGYILTLL